MSPIKFISLIAPTEYQALLSTLSTAFAAAFLKTLSTAFAAIPPTACFSAKLTCKHVNKLELLFKAEEKREEELGSAHLFMVCLPHFSNACGLDILWQLEHRFLDSPFALQIFPFLGPVPRNWNRISVSLQISTPVL